MRVTAKADYAVRATVELAASSPTRPQGRRGRPGPGHPRCRSWRTSSRSCAAPGSCAASAGPRAATGWPSRPSEVTLAQVIRAVEGPLVGVRGQRPEEIEYGGSAESLQQVWIALRANLRKVLEHVTVADVAAGKLPKEILALTREEDAWQTR